MLLDGMRADVRTGIRSLLSRPGFAAGAVLTLALGIGANTAVFSVIRHVLLAPLPYADPDRAVVIWSKWRGFDKTWVSDAEAVDYQTRIQAFAEAGAWGAAQVNLTGDGDPMRIGAARVTPNLWSVLGVQPFVGRGFTDADAAPDTPTVAILSYGLWQRRFAGADVIGRTVLVNGVAREIVGVMPRGFQLPTDYVVDAEEPTQLWTPFRLDRTNRGNHGLNAAARLRDGATVESANAELQAFAGTLVREKLYSETMQFRAFVVTTTDEAVAAVRPALRLVFGAVICLLLIACANVANLLLVRADGRTREMAVRAALGASRGQLIRQLLVESAALALVAAAAGVGLAWGALRWLVSTSGSSIPRAGTIALDWRVLAFAAVLAIGALFLFALAPAVRAARVDLVDGLKDGSANASPGRRKQRLRGSLVIAEVALALVLLAGASLMLRTLWNLQRIDFGFEPDRVLTLRLALPPSQYDTPDRVHQFYRTLLSEVRALPGVERAGLLRLVPLATSIGDWGLTIEGFMPPPGINTPGDWQIATDGGPEALGERLVAGRWLSETDVAGAAAVGLINQAMAQKYWPGADALGKRFRQGPPERPWITVVGIVGNVRHNGLTAEVKPKFYRPIAQWPESTGNPARNMTLIAKTSGDPLALVAPVRGVIRRLDAELPIAAIRPMDEIVKTAVATPRLTGWLLGSFALLAVALAAVGIYSVLSYVVSQRRQEIAIRVAIGAGRLSVISLVTRQGLALAAAGTVIGLVGAVAASRFIASLLTDVSPLDPATFAITPVALLAVAVGAAMIPAWRATRVDPARAMRQD